MGKAKRWAILGVIFLSGLAMGVVGTGLYVRHMVKVRLNQVIAGDSDQVAAMVVNHLGAALELTPEQEQAILPAVAKGVEEVRQVRAELKPRFMAIYQHSMAGINPHLRPEQKAKLQEILAKVERGLKPDPGVPPSPPRP